MTTSKNSTWLIGHDGSEGAGHAVAWALAQAVGRSLEMRLLRTWQIPPIDFPLPMNTIDDFAPPHVCEDIEEINSAAAAIGATVSAEIVRGATTQVLLDASEDAAMLVIGSRGLGGFRRLLLGSVSMQCATHARVPTVVVPSTAVPKLIRRIVVGVDGSERSQRALDWALNFAPDGCEVTVVGAWIQSRSGFIAVTQHYTDELDQARLSFNQILDAREADAGATLFERRFAYADPATTLLDETDGADLLVVGQRGHSGLSAAVLGSVATHVLHASKIPVAVIPDSE